jgi:hypothetical protein
LSAGYATVTGTALPSFQAQHGDWCVVVLDLQAVAARLATTNGTVTVRSSEWWAATAGSLPASVTAAWMTATTEDTSAVVPCSSYAPCSATHCSYTARRREAACVFVRINGASFAVIAISSFGEFGTKSVVSAPFMTTRVGVEVTAMATDDEMRLYLVACNEVDAPSQLFKFRSSDAAVTGLQLFQRQGLTDEVVRMLEVDLTRRSLTVTLVAGLTMEVRTLNLFGVRSVTPSIIDASGGTLVTIKGEGFQLIAVPMCRLTADESAPATFIDNETVTCVAPRATTTGGKCLSLIFNLAFGNRSTDASNVPYQRPASAVVTVAVSTRNNRGYAREGDATTIVLRGTGFIMSSWASCAIVTGTTRRLDVVLGPARLLNTTAVSCSIAETVMKTSVPAWIVYSHDGTVYSTSAAPFAVVGVAHGLAVASPADFTTIRSASIVRLPTVVLRIVDAEGNALFEFDGAERPITVQLLQRAEGGYPAAWANDTELEGTMTRGELQLDRLFLQRPSAGSLELLFTEHVTSWTATVLLDVLVGLPAQLVLDTTNSTEAVKTWTFGIGDGSKLNPAPVLFVTDAAGNRITNRADLPHEVLLTYSSVDTQSTTSLAQREVTARESNGRYVFDNVIARGLHKQSNQLRFSAVDAPHIATLVVFQIPTEPCAQAEYAVPDTTNCVICPDHGICDGTSEVAVENNYWRPSRSSFSFMSCAPPYSADSCDMGTCKPGYEGPRCSVCAEGRGKTGLECLDCPSATLSYFLLFLITVFLLIVLFFFVIKSIRAGSEALPGQKRDILPIVFRMLLNHFQVSAVVGLSNVSIPNAMADFFRGQQTVSSFNPNLSFVACVLAPTYDQQFILIAVLPYGVILLFCMIQVVRMAYRTFAGRAEVNVFEDPVFYEGEVERNKRALFAEIDGNTGSLMMSSHESRLGGSRRMSTSHRMSSSGAPDQVGLAVLPYLQDDEPFDAVEELRKTDTMNSIAAAEEAALAAAADASIVETLAERSLRKSLKLQWFDLFAVTVLVVLHMIYPTIIDVSGNVLLCETIDYGTDRPPRSVLIVDRSIDCASAEYETLRVWAFVHLFVYGVGFPLFIVAFTKVVAVVSMGGSTDDAKRLFFFVTGGYADKRWYWESVVLARKAAVVTVAFAILDARMRVYASIWTMSVGFMLNAIVQPYSDKMLYRLETSSLMAISVSLNLSLLFNYFTVDSDPGVYYTVLTLIFIVNGVVLLAFVYGLAVASRTKLIALGKEYPAVFGPIARALFEDTVEALEMQVASKRDERAALNHRLRRLMPRTYLLSDTLAGRMKEIRFAPDADRALAHYGSLLHTAAVRLERLPDPTAQLRELYDAERAVLAAELSTTQAYRHEEFSNVLLRLEMM